MARLAQLLTSMVNLRSLDLSNTSLTSDDLRQMDLSGNPKLETLRLGNCSLMAGTMADASLWKVDSLRRLDLRGSVRFGVESLPFERLRKLESLVLTGNKISNLNSLRLPPGLLELGLEGCGHDAASHDVDLSIKAPNLKCLRLPFPVFSQIVLPESLERVDTILPNQMPMEFGLTDDEYQAIGRIDTRLPKLEALNIVTNCSFDPSWIDDIYFPSTLKIANLASVFDSPSDRPTGHYVPWRRWSARFPPGMKLVEQHRNAELAAKEFEEAVGKQLPHLVPWMW